jgi:hypothetical protein
MQTREIGTFGQLNVNRGGSSRDRRADFNLSTPSVTLSRAGSASNRKNAACHGFIARSWAGVQWLLSNQEQQAVVLYGKSRMRHCNYREILPGVVASKIKCIPSSAQAVARVKILWPIAFTS